MRRVTDMTPFRIPYGRQNIDQADIDAVMEVLKSPWLTQGPTIERFEKALAKRCQAEHAVVSYTHLTLPTIYSV